MLQPIRVTHVEQHQLQGSRRNEAIASMSGPSYNGNLWKTVKRVLVHPRNLRATDGSQKNNKTKHKGINFWLLFKLYHKHDSPRWLFKKPGSLISFWWISTRLRRPWSTRSSGRVLGDGGGTPMWRHTMKPWTIGNSEPPVQIPMKLWGLDAWNNSRSTKVLIFVQ